MAVAAEHERHVQAFGIGVGFRLLQTVAGRQVLGFGFQDGDGDGLRIGLHDQAQGIVGASLWLAAGLAVDDLDSACGHFALDGVFCPAEGMDGRVNEFGAGIGFIVRHGSSCVSDLRRGNCCPTGGIF